MIYYGSISPGVFQYIVTASDVRLVKVEIIHFQTNIGKIIVL